MKPPVVSIGMPVYNGERFLREALESLLGQSFTDFELIISDNASTDGTEAICREAAAREPRIRYIRQAENIGAVANFQLVLEEASGDSFMWASYDDRWDKEWLAKLTEKLANGGAIAAFGRVYPIDHEGNRRKYYGRHHARQFCGGRLRRRVAFFMEFEGVGKANRIYSLFRRETMAGLDISEYGMDCYILFELLKQVEFVSVDGVCIHKRSHGSNCGAADSARSPDGLGERLLLQALRRNWRLAVGYLKHTNGAERLLFSLLVPVKMIHTLWFKVRARRE